MCGTFLPLFLLRLFCFLVIKKLILIDSLFKGNIMKTIESKNAPAPIGPYAQAVEINGFIFTSGQIALDPVTGNLVSENLEEQVHQVFKNLIAVLEAGDTDLSKVVKTTIYLKNMSDFTLVNKIYADYFGTATPARSTVEVSRLPKDVLIEIDCIVSK